MSDEEKPGAPQGDAEQPKPMGRETLMGSPWVCPKCEAVNKFYAFECKDCKTAKPV